MPTLPHLVPLLVILYILILLFLLCYDLEHQIRCAKNVLVVGVHWCAAYLVCIAHHSFYSVVCMLTW